MLKTNEVKMSDHRGQFIDIDMKRLGVELEERIGANNRLLSGNKPETIKKYLEKLETDFEKHNIIRKVKELDDGWETGKDGAILVEKN